MKDLEEEESSTDDDASTDEELINPEFDEEFFKTMAFLKDKNPEKYQKIPSFFENVQTIEDIVESKQLRKGDKPITVADYQRDRLIKTQGKMSDDEDEKKVPEDLSYAAEQEKIKNDLKKALVDSSDDEEGKLFKVREKTVDQVKKEQKDYDKWVGTQSSKSTKPLKDFWKSNNLSTDDKFLRDYILKQKYLPGDGNEEEEQQDLIGLSDDEVEVEKQAEYEQKYNFRYEEPDNEFIKRFPRTIENSVRAEKTKRKEQRKERDERKAKEKELKMKELREVNSIRKREIEEKLLLLKDVAGNDNLHEMLDEQDLNSDFDPDAHDKRMTKIFNDEYYGIDEGDRKPEFPDIDEELAIENWDNFEKKKEAPHCEDDDFIMDCDYDPEEEKKHKLQDELIQMSKGRKRKKKISKLAEIINKEKPAFDPSSEKTYAEYLDEYYQLDYEDVIGDQPCRFKYSECIPNDFGLTVDEILMASNKELNQWASLKKTMQNRPRNVELNDVEKYQRMKNNLELKKKIFKSMFGEQEEAAEESQSGSDEKKSEVAPTAPKKKKKKSKKKKNPTVEEPEASEIVEKSKKIVEKPKKIVEKPKKRKIEEDAPTPSSPKKLKTDDTELPQTEPSKKSKKVKNDEKPSENLHKFVKPLNNHQNGKKAKFEKKKWKPNSPPKTIGDNRLKAFGINPKKYYGKIKYGQQNQQNVNGKRKMQ